MIPLNDNHPFELDEFEENRILKKLEYVKVLNIQLENSTFSLCNLKNNYNMLLLSKNPP